MARRALITGITGQDGSYLQAPAPDDFVIATGETHSVREFCELAFAEANLDYRDHVVIDERFYRPAEVDLLIGDASKARQILGWEPKTTFRDLVREMAQEDLRSYKRLRARTA